MKRLRVPVLIAVSVSLALGGLAVTSPASAEEPRRVLWGAFGAPRSGEGYQQAVQRLEALADRRLDVVREFVLWDQPFPTSYEPWVLEGGRTLMLSVKTRRLNGQNVPWRDLAAAQPGSALYNQMVGWAQRVKALGVPTYVTMNHEPEAEASRSMGTDAEFKAAWQAWVTVFRAQGVTNATFNWIMTDYSFQVSPNDRRYAAKWYPGDAYVDVISADAYNWFTCRPGILTAWKSLAQIIEAQRVFGLAHPNQRLYLAEYGTVEDPAQPGRKAQWFADAQALFALPAYSQFAGVNQFENLPGRDCLWVPDSSSSAAAAWRAWGADPVYGGSAAPPPPPPPPPPSGKALLVVGNAASLGNDATVRARVEGLGYSVAIVDDSAATAATTTGYDVVLVSQTTAPEVLTTRLRDIAVPVVMWKPWLYDDFGLTAANALGSSGRTTITITDPTHPLAAGLSGAVTVVTSTTPTGWGTTLPSAQVVATVPGGATVFAYRPGAALTEGRSARACRIGLPFHSDGIPRLTPAGWAIFDAAVVWADRSC